MGELVTLQNVGRLYRRDRTSVVAIHLGECLAVAGPSGSSKSTLLNLIGCIDQLTSLPANELAEIRRHTIGECQRVPDGPYAALHAKLGNSRKDVPIPKWEDLAACYRQGRGLFNEIFAFSGITVFFMVVVSSGNKLMISMFERTREIGAMLAMGTKRSWIQSLFLAEGLVTGILGALVGVASTRVLGQLLNRSGLPVSDAPLPFHLLFTPEIVLGASLLLILTLAIASLAPAIPASRLKIVEALAHV